MKKLSMLSFLFLAFFVATSAMFLNPSVVSAASVCPLVSASNRTIVDFFTATHGIIPNCVGYCVRSDMTAADATFGPVAFSLAPGNYDVTLVSFDDHHDKLTNYQPNEIWKVILKNSSGTQLAVTNPISDLPDADDWRTEMVNSSLNITGSVFSATAFHANYKNLYDSTPNSITPICAAFDLIPAPAIKVVKSAVPTSLPVGGGNVVYSFVVTNIGNVTLTDVVLIDDKCSPVNRINGDTNSNSQLETTEIWNYTCSKNLTATTINIAAVTGKYLTTTVDDTDTATVTVNPPTFNPAIKVVKSAVPTSLPVGGGNVVYSFVVTNIGNVTLTDVVLTDDKCSPVNYVNGDTNSNSQLETTEIWNYTCSKNITQDTTNTATATGIYNSASVQDTDSATVTVALPQTCVSGCGGVTLFPAIRLIKTPAPYQLSRQGGLVIYTYLVSNPGYYAITDVVLIDDKCSEVKFIDGDKNTDKKLDRNEIWKYTCQTNLTATTINTATVNGKSSAGSVKDTAKATVYVPKMDLAIKLEKTANPESLSEKGGLVTYSYKVFNKGSKAISDVTLTDDKCNPVNLISGDTNKDKKLDTAETWLYTCQASIAKTTTNTGTVRGQVDGKYATDTSSATVRVEKVLGTPIIPKGMPKTGFGGGEIISGYGFKQALIAIFILLAIAIVKPRIKKRYY